MAFEPSTLSNKRLWLRARDLPLGQTVTAWADKSGMSRHPNVFSGGQVGTFQDAFTIAAATASSSYQDPRLAFKEDGDFWESGGGFPQWLQAQIDQPRAATAYSFTPRPGWPSRTPTSWVFMGSNDGVTWTNLDSRSNQPAWSDYEIRVFKFANTTPYLYYRLHVTAASGAGLVNLANMRIGTEVNNPVVWHGFGNNLIGLIPENSSSAERELWIRFRPFGYTWGNFADLGTDSGSNHFPGADGNAYLDTFQTSRPGFAPTGLVIRQWQLLRVSLTAAGVWAVDLNGTRLIQQNVAKGDSSSPTLVGNWPGQISEVLIRDKVSSAAEVTDLTTYFNNPPPDVNTVGSGLYDFAGTQREVFRWDGVNLVPVTWNRF